MSNPRCKSCRWWDEIKSSRIVGIGLCRRFPPGEEGWPNASRDDWCGAHEICEAVEQQMADSEAYASRPTQR